MSASWYVVRDGKRSGPFSSAQLKEMVASGQLQPTDLVFREGMEKLVPASKVKGLFPTENGPPPPQPTVHTDSMGDTWFGMRSSLLCGIVIGILLRLYSNQSIPVGLLLVAGTAAAILLRVSGRRSPLGNLCVSAECLGLGIVVGTFYTMSCSFAIANMGIFEWVRQNTVSGKLGYFLSLLQLGMHLLWLGWKERLRSYAVGQLALLGTAMLLLLAVDAGESQLWYVSLLSWSLFFLLNDWFTIESYLSKTGMEMELTDFLKICVGNALMIIALVCLTLDLSSQSEHRSRIPLFDNVVEAVHSMPIPLRLLEVVVGSVIGLIAWAVSVLWLFSHVRIAFFEKEDGYPLAGAWYIERDGKRYGPFSPAQLKEQADRGQIQPTELVIKEGMEKPVPAAKLKGLFADSQSAGVTQR